MGYWLESFIKQTKRSVQSKVLYINFYFTNLQYDDDMIMGDFLSRDSDVQCRFIYNRRTEKVEVFENNKPLEDILPLPIWWLNLKLEENGKLNETEAKISY